VSDYPPVDSVLAVFPLGVIVFDFPGVVSVVLGSLPLVHPVGFIRELIELVRLLAIVSEVVGFVYPVLVFVELPVPVFLSFGRVFRFPVSVVPVLIVYALPMLVCLASSIFELL
jgi:hypothetical protein